MRGAHNVNNVNNADNLNNARNLNNQPAIGFWYRFRAQHSPGYDGRQ